MFRGHVPPVQASKARAILNLAGQEKWACFASVFARKAGLVSCSERVGSSWHGPCDLVGSIACFTRILRFSETPRCSANLKLADRSFEPIGRIVIQDYPNKRD